MKIGFVGLDKMGGKAAGCMDHGSKRQNNRKDY